MKNQKQEEMQYNEASIDADERHLSFDNTQNIMRKTACESDDAAQTVPALCVMALSGGQTASIEK